MSRPLLGCIADDFTGATDLANNLVRSGMRTLQTIGVPSDFSQLENVDAVVVALKSRTNPVAEAIEQTLQARDWLNKQGVQQLYFKYCSTFDSTAQGNIGQVTDALMDAIHGADRGFTVACPAFPANHRTVYKGHLFVGDVLLSESSMRHHPLTPMTDSNLVRVLQSQTKRRVGLVTHETVKRGHEEVAKRFQALAEEGVGIAIVDAVSNDDLMVIGAAAAGLPLVTAGSGVAIGLPANWRARGFASSALPADRLPPAEGTRAVVSGSCSQATNAQVLHFKQTGRPTFAVDPLAIAAGEDVASTAIEWAKPLVAEGPVLIYATAESNSVRAVQEQLGATHAGELVERTLSRVAVGLVDAGVKQLIVAGGETSGAVVQALGIQQMQIGPQIDPGVPWTCARTNSAHGQQLHLALKSGNFGSRDFFTKAFQDLG